MSAAQPDPDLLASFLDEAGQCIATLNERLLAAEGGAPPTDAVGEMFRAAHSMKGAASFLNLARVAKVTHTLETVLDRVRKDQLAFADAVVDRLFDALDIVSALLAELAAGQEETTDIDGVVAALEGLLEEDNTAAVDDPESQLEGLPAFLKGRLSLDDVLETLIACNNGRRAWVVDLPLQGILAAGVDPLQLYHALEGALTIQGVYPLTGAARSPFQPLEAFDYRIALLCHTDRPVEEALAAAGVTEATLHPLGEDAPAEPTRYAAAGRVDLGTPSGDLTVRPEMAKHLPTWLSETRDELDALDTTLVEWEKTPESAALLRETFRLLHRLKGSCGSMGLAELGRTVHNCESLLSRYRQARGAPEANAFRALFAAKDVLRECLDRVERGETAAPDPADLDAAPADAPRAAPAAGAGPLAGGAPGGGRPGGGGALRRRHPLRLSGHGYRGGTRRGTVRPGDIDALRL